MGVNVQFKVCRQVLTRPRPDGRLRPFSRIKQEMTAFYPRALLGRGGWCCLMDTQRSDTLRSAQTLMDEGKCKQGQPLCLEVKSLPIISRDYFEWT